MDHSWTSSKSSVKRASLQHSGDGWGHRSLMLLFAGTKFFESQALGLLMCLVFLYLLFWGKVSLNFPGWPWSPSVYQVSLRSILHTRFVLNLFCSPSQPWTCDSPTSASRLAGATVSDAPAWSGLKFLSKVWHSYWMGRLRRIFWVPGLQRD